MPSSPKIPKDKILENALNILIRDGYQAVTIKSLAAEIGCSTQPISWHFGSMEGLRRSLFHYARDYAKSKLHSEEEDVLLAFQHLGYAYVQIAVKEPNLFRFLYLEGYNGACANNFDALARTQELEIIYKRMQETYGISSQNALDYVRNTTIYIHGIAALIATNIIHVDNDTITDLVHRASCVFLKQAGIQPEDLPGIPE